MCAGIPVKSAHDIRRTVASEMNVKGVPLEIIRGYLGHSDIKTTQGYIINNREKQETNHLIIHALSDMNDTYVLKGTH
ncbi:tyrosine-type recombinase/integrase [Anaerosporobacter faecicola]|uniref:tyrosine-type recombinase/integrase n=1 Tax=Anaerosporobacter faecicola TaxID=2718714 RepID=UPI0038BBB7A9